MPTALRAIAGGRTDWFPKLEYGLCRTLTGHAWSPAAEGFALAGGGVMKVTLRCTRCRARRIDRYGYATGVLNGRTYRHEEGYRLTPEKGEKRLPERSVLRREVLHALKGVTHHEKNDAAVRPVRRRAAAGQ